MSTMTNNRLAILLVTLQMVCYAAEGVVVHSLGRSVSAMSLMTIRSISGVVFVLLLSRGRLAIWPAGLFRLYVARCSAFVASVYLSVIAYTSGLPLANVIAIMYLQAVVLTLYSAVLKEPATPFRWVMIVIGFAGAIMVIQPETTSFSLLLFYLAPLGWAIMNPAALALSRKITLHQGDSTLTQLFWVNMAGVVIGLVGMSYDGSGIMTLQPSSLAPLAGVAIFGPLGMLLGILAVRCGPLSLVAQFQYLRLPLAAAPALVLFGEVPNVLAITGGLVILLSCCLGAVSPGQFGWGSMRAFRNAHALQLSAR
jgi:S-adenosylmethionine uptake transporter